VGRVAQSVQRLATGWTVRRSNPGGVRDFPNPSRPALWPTQPPVQWELGHFPVVKRLGDGVNRPPIRSAEVKERVQLYVYFPLQPSWQVTRWTSTFIFRLKYAGSARLSSLLECFLRQTMHFNKVLIRRFTLLHMRGNVSNEGTKIIYRKIKTEFERTILSA
jgi:hypothetical protein